MPLTGLFLLPIAPGQSSPSPTLISHISRSFPAEPLPNFNLDHRLFVDTSSLHPAYDASLRKSTSLMTLSHTPLTTYVSTTSPKGRSQASGISSQTSTHITIPSSAADSFTQLIGTKLQPLWTHRQSLVIENGTALSLKDGEWTLRIGDLKNPPRPNQAGPNLRGMLVEVSHMDDDDDKIIQASKDGRDEANTNSVDKDDEALLRGFLESVTDGSGVSAIINPETSRSLIRRTSPQEKDRGAPTSSPDFKLAVLYLDILRGPRG
ncbi:hypothetical protein H2200_008272 [Cladophialophora chaetospira]|uniref:Mediator of RNA polymerase II transcription subunit 20 n=1 Tax=Cladophialophora chaetospira TaxID=386627 RepID=A0AA38X5G2_9EURO|nr:hypothetical protein H2200_008272 [Cladophialophora chaetospira]